LEVESSITTILNVLGFMNNNKLESYIFECTINGDIIVALEFHEECLDSPE